MLHRNEAWVPMHCPKCESAMTPVVYKGYTVERCARCEGLWFRPDDLDTLRRDDWLADYYLDTGKAGKGREYDRITAIECPVCGTLMTVQRDKRQRHIQYEVCPEGHGVFLDAGEFRDLVHETLFDTFRDLAAGLG